MGGGGGGRGNCEGRVYRVPPLRDYPLPLPLPLLMAKINRLMSSAKVLGEDGGAGAGSANHPQHQAPPLPAQQHHHQQEEGGQE